MGRRRTMGKVQNTDMGKAQDTGKAMGKTQDTGKAMGKA